MATRALSKDYDKPEPNPQSFLKKPLRQLSARAMFADYLPPETLIQPPLSPGEVQSLLDTLVDILDTKTDQEAATALLNLEMSLEEFESFLAALDPAQEDRLNQSATESRLNAIIAAMPPDQADDFSWYWGYLRYWELLP